MADFVCRSLVLFQLIFLLMRAGGSNGQMAPAVFVFGDSLVDAGNNNYLPLSIAKANFPHNGIDFPGMEATGRFSNGKNAADLLAEKVELPSSPPYLSIGSNSGTSCLTGVNFASGGAAIFNATNPLNTQCINFWEQVEYYLKVQKDLTSRLGASGARNHLSKSLFFISIGSNDILAYSRSSDLIKAAPQVYINTMTALLKAQLKRLYSYNARKFVVVGVPPIGCCPSQRIKNETRGCREDTNTWSVMYNRAIVSMLQAFKSELKDLSYTYCNTYSLVKSFIEDPASYGFTEVKSACCGLGDLNAQVPCLPISTHCSNRRNHLFWDLYHPTEAASRLFIDNVFDGPPQYSSPINVRQLIAV